MPEASAAAHCCQQKSPFFSCLYFCHLLSCGPSPKTGTLCMKRIFVFIPNIIEEFVFLLSYFVPIRSPSYKRSINITRIFERWLPPCHFPSLFEESSSISFVFFCVFLMTGACVRVSSFSCLLLDQAMTAVILFINRQASISFLFVRKRRKRGLNRGGSVILIFKYISFDVRTHLPSDDYEWPFFFVVIFTGRRKKKAQRHVKVWYLYPLKIKRSREWRRIILFIDSKRGTNKRLSLEQSAANECPISTMAFHLHHPHPPECSFHLLCLLAGNWCHQQFEKLLWNGWLHLSGARQDGKLFHNESVSPLTDCCCIWVQRGAFGRCILVVCSTECRRRFIERNICTSQWFLVERLL